MKFGAKFVKSHWKHIQDNGAVNSDNVPLIFYNTGGFGANDHGLDFGFYCVPPDLSVQPAMAAFCDPGSIDLSFVFAITDANNSSPSVGFPKYYVSTEDAADDMNALNNTVVASEGVY